MDADKLAGDGAKPSIALVPTRRVAYIQANPDGDPALQSLLFALYTYFFHPILTLLFFVLLIYVVFSWLFSFGVVSMSNPQARQIYDLLASVVEPLARPIRNVLPSMGQLDLSILVLVLGILFTRDYALPTLIAAVPI
ncbi:MAG: YggT family protein [Pseudomonadota bacterium]